MKTPRIIEAFKKIKRIDFLPEDTKELAEVNGALPIGYGQTISQPLVVAFMLELLQPQEGDKILDVGSGSGWTSALLAEIVGTEGKVFAFEVVPELMEFGKTNVAKYNFIEKKIAEFICADGSKGYEKEAPYDKILASASAKAIPRAWKEQIIVEGRIVTPVDHSIYLLVKKTPSIAEAKEGKETEFEKTEHPGFVFVPLVTNNKNGNRRIK